MFSDQNGSSLSPTDRFESWSLAVKFADEKIRVKVNVTQDAYTVSSQGHTLTIPRNISLAAPTLKVIITIP